MIPALFVVYVVVNIAVFALYVIDKRRAVKDAWRISESALLTGAFFGPWGAAVGMHAAHHKTRKPRFRLVYVFAVLHVVLFALVLVYE